MNIVICSLHIGESDTLLFELIMRYLHMIFGRIRKKRFPGGTAVRHIIIVLYKKHLLYFDGLLCYENLPEYTVFTNR